MILVGCIRSKPLLRVKGLNNACAWCCELHFLNNPKLNTADQVHTWFFDKRGGARCPALLDALNDACLEVKTRTFGALHRRFWPGGLQQIMHVAK